MVRRVVSVVVLLVALVFAYVYTSGANSAGIESEFQKVAGLLDISAQERAQVRSWIQECHSDIYAQVSAASRSASDSVFDGGDYAKRMFTELISRAKREGNEALAELLAQTAGEVSFDVVKQ